MPSNSSFVCVLFGPMTSTKWWNIEVTGLASESIARHHGYGMMSNDEVLGFAVFESGKDWWRHMDSCLLKNTLWDTMEAQKNFLFAILTKLFCLIDTRKLYSFFESCGTFLLNTLIQLVVMQTTVGVNGRQ